MSHWLLWAWLAGAAPATGLDPVGQAFWERTEQALARGDHEAALTASQLVLDNDPYFVAARVVRGRALLALGRDAEGVEALEAALPDPEAFEVLCGWLMEQGRYAEALPLLARWQDRDPTASAPWREEARARLALGQPALALRRYQLALQGEAPDEALVLALADALQEQGDTDEARGFLLRLEWPDGIPERVAEREDWWRLLSVAEARRQAGAVRLSAVDRAALQALRRRLAAESESRDAVTALLESFAARHPRAPEVWLALADARAEADALDGVGEALATAVSLAPDDPQVQARWARHLDTHFGGRLAGRAADAFAAAARRAPFEPQLWADWARTAAQAERYDEAREAAAHYLELAPAGPAADAMRTLTGDLARKPPVPARLPEGESCPAEVPDEACDAFFLAQVLQDEERLDEALEQARRAGALAPSWWQVSHLEAQVLWQLGRTDAARERWQRMLDERPDDVLIHNLLASAAASEGDAQGARERWTEAAALGSDLARLELARLDWASGHWLAARQRLATYQGGTDGDDGAAAALRERFDRTVGALGVLGLGGLLGGLLAWRWWRGGETVDDLLSRAPRLAPELARLAATVRHEVIKHRTTLLPALAAQLDAGDVQHAAWASGELAVASERFGTIEAQLVDLARGHGVRLALGRDPVFGPLRSTFQEIDRHRAALRTGTVSTDLLRRWSQALNVEGYRGLGRLVRRVTATRIDADWLGSLAKAVVREPRLRDESLEIEVDLDGSVEVGIYPSELHDVLTNLLRNAAHAVVQQGGGRVGVRVGIEADPITGLEEVCLRVRDTARGRLTTAMIRGRFIERGLGLAVDLVSRAGGSIRVEREPGWEKAVVVRLRRIEREAEHASIEEAA